VPRCSAHALGGAEALALQLAADLAAVYDVEIITTCADDYWTWENVHPEGPDRVGGIAVRRFAVDAPRNMPEFDRLSRRFRYRIASLSVKEQETWLRAQGPYSTSMLRFIAETDRYDAFAFLTYLYATTYFGLPLVRDRAILLPLAHDEWPLYFPIWDDFFDSVRSFAFASPESLEFVRHRFPNSTISGDVIQPAIAGNRREADASAGIDRRPFILYVGRIDQSKGVNDLCELFENYVRSHPASTWNLVLAGPYVGTPRQTERIHYLGAVDEATKYGLLGNCDLFAMPSYHESLCIALLEAWGAGCASLVNGWNPVLVGQSQRSNAGLWYRDQRSFDAALDLLDAPTRATLGKQGIAFVERYYARGNAVEVFGRALRRLGA